MKVLIELDNDMFKDIRESDFELSRKIVRDFQATISDSIRNGTPISTNATNGDMIKAMFPNELLTSITSTLWWGDNMSFNKDWWNAPYKGVEE